MGRLEDRQKFRIREAREARRRINARANEFGPIYRCMTVASAQQEYRDAISARWRGGPSVLAFLFAQPDSDAMRMLDARGEYFDIRSGDTWRLIHEPDMLCEINHSDGAPARKMARFSKGLSYHTQSERNEPSACIIPRDSATMR